MGQNGADDVRALLAPTLPPLALTALGVITATWLVGRWNAGWASMITAAGIWLCHFTGTALLMSGQTGGMDAALRLMPDIVTSCGGFLLTGLGLAAVAFEQRLTRRLAQESRRFRILADATLDGVILERHGQIADVNHAICGLTERDANGLIGRPLSDLIPGIELRLSERRHPVAHAVRLHDGRSVPVEVMWCNGPDAGGRVVVVRDLSREKAAEREIERLTHVDPLTGLLNRDVLEQKMQQALSASAEAGTKLAVLYIDLDRFGRMNEAVGHRAVEEILIQMAGRLSGLVRETGLAARLGRDTFAIVQPLTQLVPDAAVAAERVLAEMVPPFWVNEQPVAMTASIGVAVYPDDNTDADGLLECAILALCQAKRDGNGRWCRFRLDMDQLVQKKRLLGHDLRIALKEDQFTLHYQPFVDTATLEVVGYEALLRWDHPKRGRVSPADFIPLAEESGLIVPIGSWVLAAACAEAASWDNAAIISVNLSPAQFIQRGIVRPGGRGAAPDRPAAEPAGAGNHRRHPDGRYPERTAYPEFAKGLGVKIAMDDFGTGYSSLSYLRKFPFDKIKIDRSFINDADRDLDAETIVQAIIAMGRSLRLNVTAEGVETREQLAMLRALGCDFVQGYLLGRPCSADQLDVRSAEVMRPVVIASPALAASIGAPSG